MALPGLLFVAVLFLYPFIETAVKSFVDPSPANYEIFAQSAAYRKSLLTTFRTAFLVSLSCLVLGYPYAYAMHKLKPRARAVLSFLVLLPFGTSLLVRTYAWTVWLQDNGIVNRTLQALGLTDGPLPLIRTTFAVTVGMTHALLPFMVFPVYAAMKRVPTDLVPAAISLGAKKSLAFRRVFLPLTMPGVMAGTLLVFVLSLGYYITPALLGSPRDGMLSELIVNQVSTQLNFGVGAAVGMVLMVMTLITLFLGTRLVKFSDLVDWRN
ncbi:ABC transporter permease [Streptomyces sp. NPDC006385]|uniref:ABC transporter permease n=1 Tax=Streptomyces sp. NPDC006385 TaxID=3156761 RepID=UPI0033B344DB